jgi:hypothetical protein
MKKILAYIVALGLIATLAWAPPAAAWKITSLSTNPSGEVQDGSKLIVICSFEKEPLFDLENQYAQIVISDNGIVKDSVGITDSDSRGTYYNIQGVGSHAIKCKIAVKGPQGEPMLSPEKTVFITVTATAKKPGEGTKPQEAKWSTAPFIVTPGQNQKVLAPVKILVKPRDPNKNCTDNGVLWLSKEKQGPKKLSGPIPTKNCKPEGAIWELDLIPGVYQVKAKHTNKKYNFASDWSDWVTFEVIK